MRSYSPAIRTVLQLKPLCVRVSNMEFFQDPNDVEKRGVTTTLDFNMPVEAQAVKEHLQFVLEELTDDASPTDRKIIARAEKLPFELQLNEDGTQATVTTPIKTLPDKERFLKVVVQPGLMALAGGQPLTAGKPESNSGCAFRAGSIMAGSKKSRCALSKMTIMCRNKF